MTVAMFMVALTVVQPAKDDAVQSELKRLVGTWEVESISFLGQKLPADSLKGETLSVKDGKYETSPRVALSGFSSRGVLVVDPVRMPATLTRHIVRTPGAKPVEKSDGIYKLEGDRLTVCFGDERPTSFEATDKVSVMAFRRSKPDPSKPDKTLDKQAAIDMGKLQGKWERVVAERDGEEFGRDPVAFFRHTFEFNDDKFSLVIGKGPAVKGRVKLDPAASPKTIDLVYEGNLDLTLHGQVRLGIYEIDGDTLRWCCTDLDSKVARPKQFKTSKRDDLMIETFKRVK
jgi:uncharacterized protein (TIGR03067 family)